MLKLYIGQPYLKLVCGINHNKDVIVVRGADEQFTPGSERWASRSTCESMCRYGGLRACSPWKILKHLVLWDYFWLLLKIHPLLKVKGYVMDHSQWFRLTNWEAVSWFWTTAARHRTSEHVYTNGYAYTIKLFKLSNQNLTVLTTDKQHSRSTVSNILNNQTECFAATIVLSLRNSPLSNKTVHTS